MESPIALAKPTLVWPIVTDDLRTLHTVDELLAESRLVADRRQSPRRTVMIYMPDDLAKRLGPERWLNLGLTDATFASALHWIQSPDPQMQWCGAEVLIQENSPENAAALLQFSRSMQFATRYGPEAEARVIQTLSNWGVKDIPPLIQSTPIFNGRHWTAWLSLTGFLIAPGAYIVWRKRSARIVTTTWILLLSGVIVMGIRSYWPQDAVAWGDVDLAFERGNLYIEHQERSKSGLATHLLITTPQNLLRWRWIHFPVYMRDELNDLGEMGGGGDFAQPTYYETKWKGLFAFFPAGYWARFKWHFHGPIIQISLWWILLALICPVASVSMWRQIKHLRARRIRGFPVELSP